MSKLTECKQTEIAEIPKDWNIAYLGDSKLANLIMGQSPFSATYNKVGKGLPFLQGNAEFGDKYPKPTIYCSEPIKIAEQSDILISVRAPVGDINMVKSKVCIGRGLAAIRPNQKILSKVFLYYHLQHNKRKFEMLSAGSTFKAIRRNEFDLYEISLPSLPEQRKIAEILGTVDEAIEKVDEAIKKTERLKNGLMQELLTNGIGHKEFKDTEIGRIPKEWEVAHLSNVTVINKEAKDLPRDYPNSRFFYIDIDSVENETGNIRKVKEIMGKDAPSRARRVVHYNDVIMSTVRPYLKAFALVPENYDRQICSTGFAVLTSKGNLNPHYLLYTLFSKVVIDQCNKMMVGGQYPALNTQQVSRIVIPVPSVFEQKKIANVLCTLDRRLEQLRRKKGKFEKIKRGLMNNLLTGRRRVRI